MANKPGLVARMFGRTKNSVVTQLFTHAIGRPLLVHPVMGEALLGAYLEGAIDVPQPVVEGPGDGLAAPAEGQPQKVVRVLNISGGLVNRPMPDACGPGPVSYEAIARAFDEAIDDDGVKAVVLRIASPGGMAAGCFDLADRIFAARGKKPIYAMVDDYAYSAAYGIACAADEIWLTRTGGVGSVGVICWHYEQSEYNKKIGLKVTPIYSGARKVDYSPHMPLSKEAFEAEQAEVDRLRDLFVESVAKYRGMDADAVRATEAGTFNGPVAVAAGMADNIGTFRDLLAHIDAAPPAAEQPQAAVENDEEATNGDAPAAASEQPTGGAAATMDADAGDGAAVTITVDASEAHAQVEGLSEKVDAANKAAAIADADLPPDLAMALLKASFPAAEAPARIEHAKKVADLCAAANRSDLAAGFVKKHTDVEKVRSDLINAAAKSDEKVEISNAQPKQPSAARAVTRSEDIYSRRREAAAAAGK